MKIGLFSDSLVDLGFDAMLAWLDAEGIQAVEIGTGNFSPSPHCQVEKLVQDDAARNTFRQAISDRGLDLSALNCNGNLLDPHPERRASALRVYHNTILAASKLGVGTVVTMSGCPGDPSGGTYPNWVTCTWQKEYVELLERQWEEVITPFWSEAGKFAADHGVRVAIEMHPGQAVYNTRTLQRLREIVGSETLGANLDPSHLFFQNMDPLVVVRALGPGAIFHVHAKDTRIDPQEMALNGSLDTRPMGTPGVRSWDYVTMGYGQPESFWRQFIRTLRLMGYDGALSIEHEDRLMGVHEGIRKSVAFLRTILLTDRPSPGEPTGEGG